MNIGRFIDAVYEDHEGIYSADELGMHFCDTTDNELGEKIESHLNDLCALHGIETPLFVDYAVRLRRFKGRLLYLEISYVLISVLTNKESMEWVQTAVPVELTEDEAQQMSMLAIRSYADELDVFVKFNP